MTTTVDPPPASVEPAEWPATQRKVVFALAALTMATEIVSLAVDSRPHIGTIPLSLSLVPSMLVLIALGPRSNGRVVDPGRLLPFWLGIGGAYVFGWALWTRDDQAGSVVGIAVAALNEEVVYRFSVPLVLTAGLLLLRVPPSAARVAGYVVAGAWWVLLPGHRAQTDTVAMLLTFIVFATVSTIIVARSRALLPMGLAHGALNIITISQLRGDIEPGMRGILASCLVFLLVGTFAWPGDDDARARRRDAAAEGSIDDLVGDVVGDAVIDLRDGRRPSVVRGDQVTWLDEPVPDHPVTPVLDQPAPDHPVAPAAPVEPVLPLAPVEAGSPVAPAAPHEVGRPAANGQGAPPPAA